jgi:chromosome segregation ATPase
MSIVLPTSFFVSLLILLILIIKNGSFADLAASNAYETRKRDQLMTEVTPLQERATALQRENQIETAQLQTLVDQKKSAIETINQANVLKKVLEQLRIEEVALQEKGRLQKKILTETNDQLRAEEAEIQKSIIEQKRLAAGALENQRSLQKDNEALQLKIVALQAKLTSAAVKEKEIEERITEKDRGLAKRTAELAASDAAAQALASSINDKKSEVALLSGQTEQLKKTKVDYLVNERLRAEKAALTGRITILEEDLSSLESTIKNAEKTKRQLEAEITELKQSKSK